MTLTLFDSFAAVRRFAGADAEVPVIEPRAAELLADYDDRGAALRRRRPVGRHPGGRMRSVVLRDQ